MTSPASAVRRAPGTDLEVHTLTVPDYLDQELPEPALAVVVSTIGRVADFRRLVASLQGCTLADRIELILVDQSDDQGCAAVLRDGAWTLRWTALRSGRGASVGRNAGLRYVTAPVIAFPDDDAWYPPETPERIVEAFAEDISLMALCGRQTTSDGAASMLRWKSEPCLVTARNFLRTSIMSTMFFRSSWLEQHEQFDEQMGVGAAGWYGAGEESDLLLRVVEDGHDVPYDPTLVVHQDEPREHVDEGFVEKMLRYGCGQGHLWRKRRLPAALLAYYCGRKVIAATVRAGRGERMLARADLAWLRGNIAGYRDVPPRELRHLAAADPAASAPRT